MCENKRKQIFFMKEKKKQRKIKLNEKQNKKRNMK